MGNAVTDEYVELWDSVLAQQDEYLPHVVESGLAAQREKIGVDTVDLVVQRQNELRELKQRLVTLDEEYVARLAALKKKTETSPQPEPDERHVRMADFLFALVASLNRDFSRNPELNYIVQQIYLFTAQNETSADSPDS